MVRAFSQYGKTDPKNTPTLSPDTERKQQLADVDAFAHKLRVGQDAKQHEDFMVIARLEALIAGYGQEEALRRAEAYITDGGVDGIMIHSKQKDPTEVLDFLRAYRQLDCVKQRETPVVVVPTSYNSLTEEDLAQEAKKGLNVPFHEKFHIGGFSRG